MRERLVWTLANAGCPVNQIIGDGPGCTLVYMPGATAEQQALGASILASFDWSVEADQAWELERRIEEAAALLQSIDPIPIGTRATLRAICDRLNDAFRAMGQPAPLLEGPLNQQIGLYLMTGQGLPGGR